MKFLVCSRVAFVVVIVLFFSGMCMWVCVFLGSNRTDTCGGGSDSGAAHVDRKTVRTVQGVSESVKQSPTTKSAAVR